MIFVCFDEDNFGYIHRQLNFKAFTIPAKLFADTEILGTVNIGLEDNGQGVLSGQLNPTENYKKYRSFFRDTFIDDNENNLVAINKFTQDNKFRVVADDGTEFLNPVAGLLVYDFEEEPITVELCGIDNYIWGR